MRISLFFVLTLFALNAYCQDYLLDKNGSSYFYNGKEYKWKELGSVYRQYDKAFNIYQSGKRSLNTAKYLAIGGAVSIGVGYFAAQASDNISGLAYGGLAIIAGVLVETVALVYLVRGKLKASKARKKFNFEMLERHGYNSEVSLVFGGTRHGVGLIVQF